MGVEENNPEKSGEGGDSHGASVELRAPSGQLPAADPSELANPANRDGMNGANGVRNEARVALAATMRFPALQASTESRSEARPAPAIDETVLRRAAAGDSAAFREIFLRHRSDVSRLVYRMLSAPADLEDVVQEVFVQVFRSLKDFRGQSKFSTWLHRVTVNVVLMHRRAAKSRPVLTEEAPSDVTVDDRQPLPDEDAERLERMRAFERLLGRLAEKKRIAFVLHELEGLGPAEIAEIVGAPVLTVRTRLFYARRELEQMLSEEPSLANLAGVLGGGAKTDGGRER